MTTTQGRPKMTEEKGESSERTRKWHVRDQSGWNAGSQAQHSRAGHLAGQAHIPPYHWRERSKNPAKYVHVARLCELS
jgi:hypothetical protein